MIAHGLWLLLALMLVGSSLTLRRLPRGQVMSLVLIWAGIFVGLWFVIRLFTQYFGTP